MSRTFDATRSGDLDSLLSWISNHLGEGSSFMIDEVNQSPSSPMERSPEESPMIAIHPSVEEKTNIMTLEELNALRDTYSFPSGVQVRLPDEGEIITSTRPTRSQRLEKHCLLYGIVAGEEQESSARRIPNNVKGWKSKFFFVSGDEWEIPEGTPQEGIPRVSRIWGISDKHCNNPPRLYGDEPKVFEEIFRASRMAGNNLPSREAPSSSSDVGESQNPHEQARIGEVVTSYPRPNPFEVDGGKVLDPILDHFLNAPSSNPSSESCSDSSLPVELESDAMSKRVSFKKIGEKLGKTAGASSGTPVPTKGVVIGEKRAGESITSSPSKKGKADDGSKGKRVDSGPEGKKKATSSSKASAAPTVAPSRPGKGPQIISEKVEKLTLDQTATKLFHVIGQQALVLGSSLAVRNREAGEQTSLQEGRVASIETEVARLQKLAANLEQQLAESRAREQQANDELAKMKSDRGLLTDKLERSGLLVNELREALDKAKESAVEEFKSSSEFMVVVEDSASKYFGEGFDFCKVQLQRHHSDLAIDLEGTVVDQDLLAEQDEAAEEREQKNWGENKGDN
ncbi:hypothetical protein Acr_00g0058480 [Actinidia rufa]|uniref:Uncharacterized protein n=1 Tax=Actinidia rufa TaxID=165716 RepID=A0A7J0DNG3_9ERIC|nr:hypothetical protein Acr_00g0058480 [Actinidia rufa]